MNFPPSEHLCACSIKENPVKLLCAKPWRNWKRSHLGRGKASFFLSLSLSSFLSSHNLKFFFLNLKRIFFHSIFSLSNVDSLRSERRACVTATLTSVAVCSCWQEGGKEFNSSTEEHKQVSIISSSDWKGFLFPLFVCSCQGCEQRGRQSSSPRRRKPRFCQQKKKEKVKNGKKKMWF